MIKEMDQNDFEKRKIAGVILSSYQFQMQKGE